MRERPTASPTRERPGVFAHERVRQLHSPATGGEIALVLRPHPCEMKIDVC